MEFLKNNVSLVNINILWAQTPKRFNEKQKHWSLIFTETIENLFNENKKKLIAFTTQKKIS